MLRVRTIVPPCQQSAVQVVVKDEEGTVCNLSLYNVTTGNTARKVQYVCYKAKEQLDAHLGLLTLTFVCAT